MSLPVLKLGGLALAAAGVVGYHVVTGSASAGMQAGPVCITQTAHPGHSYSAPVSVTGNGKLRLSVEQIGGPAGPPYPAGGHPLPASWVSYSGTSQVTVSVPGNAQAGRYGALLVATNYGSAAGNGHKQVTIGLGAAAGTWLEVSVDAPPPPRAFCRGERPTYWPQSPPLPVCKRSQAPLQGRNVMCRVEGLVPPAVSAKNCGWSQAKWDTYIRQLELAGERYEHNPKALLKDAWCRVGGHILNRRGFYSGYRVPDNGQTGPAGNARTY